MPYQAVSRPLINHVSNPHHTNLNFSNERGLRIILTALGVLPNEVLDRTLIRDCHSLLLDTATSIIKAFALIHGFLQTVPLPAEHVIGVRSIARGALKGPHEGVGSSRRPQGVELCGIPDGLVG